MTADSKIKFDLAFLAKRLDEATESSRVLDGDVWWILSLNDAGREDFGSHGYVLTVMEREGSPGEGLAMFFDSSKRPPSKLDYAPNYTSSVDAALGIVRQLLSGDWPRILCAASLRLMHTDDDKVMDDEWRKLPLSILRTLVRELQAPTLTATQPIPKSMFPDFKCNVPLPAGTKPPRRD